MDIKDYAQMMGYLTRPRDVVPDPSTMDQEPQRTGFSNGGGYDYGSMQYKIDSVNAAFRKYKKGSLTGGRKGTMTFEQFAPIWAKENFAEGGRINFGLGGAALAAMKTAAKKITDDLDRLPTQNELIKATGKAAATIKKYFKEGIDYLKPMSKKEAAKLGGKKPTGITEVSNEIVEKFKNLKATHVSPSIDTSKVGSKGFRITFSGPIKNNFKTIAMPATKENLEIIKKQVDDVVTSNVYKNKAKVFKTPAYFRKLKKLKTDMYKKQDPFNIYENLRKYKAKKFPGSMSKDIVIQHGQPKFTTQTLSRIGLIPSNVNISPGVEKAERLRNELLTRTFRKLKKPNRSIEDKQIIIDEANSIFTGLKNQLKKTEGSGLVNFELLKLDNAGKVIKLKDTGFNPKKSLAYGEELGELDFANITRDQADQIINLGKRKIDENLMKRTTFADTKGKNVSPLNIDFNLRPRYGRGYLVEGAKSLGKKYKGSTLEALLENRKIIGAELGYEGIGALMKLLGLYQSGGSVKEGIANLNVKK